MTIEVRSTAFEHGQPIPGRYTCDGEDLSPPLQWGLLPPGTVTLALIAEDPDAPRGTWVHWVMYNIPSEDLWLPEGVPPDSIQPDGSIQGLNDFRKIGYGGPCPPWGTHRYYFRLLALNTRLDLPPGITRDRLLSAMEGHVIARGELMGTYSRARR